MTVAELTLSGFVAAYVPAAHGAPMTMRTKATCLVLVESVSELMRFPGGADFVLEAGRTEGHRDHREAQHTALYEYHSANLAKALQPILGRLDTAEIARQSVEHANAATQAGMNPVMRRQAVTSLVLAAIAAQVHADDRQTLDGLNQDGWAHATAQGQAEAEATPAKGGPPDTALVHGLALTALATLTRGGSPGAQVASTWTDQQLHAIAMGVALASGDGAAVGEATRKATAALADTGRATKTYAMQLHQSVNATYVQSIMTQAPDAQCDWVTADDPCDDCEDNADESPYDAGDVPDCPAHPNCLCNVEQAANVPALVS